MAKRVRPNGVARTDFPKVWETYREEQPTRICSTVVERTSERGSQLHRL